MSAGGNAIADGRLPSRTPLRLTALYHRHVSMGAKMIEREGWLLPESYQGVKAEVDGALESVGLADESQHPKIDIKGRGIDTFAARFLKLADAPRRPGQVSVRPSGASWEDVPVRSLCRLANDHALLVLEGLSALSTNSPIRAKNPGASDLGVYLTNVTSVLACLTLVGPNSARVLGKLTDLVSHPTDATASTCTQGPIVGIHAIIVRSTIPLGEARVSSNEIYIGRDYADYLWGAMMDAGREHGIIPIGRAAQDSIRSGTLPRKEGTRKP